MPTSTGKSHKCRGSSLPRSVILHHCFETLTKKSMACLDTYSSEQKGAPLNHRISFSNDFVDTQISTKQEWSSRETPAASADFEFSVSSHSMMSPDELFFNGRLLPIKDQLDNNKNVGQRTLRDELLVDDEDDYGDERHKCSTRWRGIQFGLKRTIHFSAGKVCKNNVSMEKVAEAKTPCLVPEKMILSNSSQELVN